MEQTLEHYVNLKQKQKEIEQELMAIRNEIMKHLKDRGTVELEAGNYRAKLILQERKEFDDQKLYKALPDPEVWRLASKPDPAKIAGLIKLNVITEESIKGTYHVKEIALLQVQKK